MIDAVAIKNFRAISDTLLSRLGKTNIFIGKNNSGKSSVLESLYFAKAAFGAVNQLNEPVLQHLLQRRITRPNLDPREFFRDYGKYGDISVEIYLGNQAVKLRVRYLPDRRTLQYILESPVTPQGVATYELQPNQQAGNIQSPNIGGLTSQIGFRELKAVTLLASHGDTFDFLSSITLIDAEFVRKIQAIENQYWGNILEDRSDKVLREILNEVYGSKVEQFSFAPHEGQFKLLTALSKHSVYIDDYGDGFRYAFAILSLASQLHNTALLLEEPEVHQHTGAIRLLFRALNSLAQRNNIQLFISTHSLDLADILLSFEDTRLFHCDITDSDEFTARPLLAPDPKLVADLGIDLRAIIEANKFLCVEGHHDKTFAESVATKLTGKTITSLGYLIVEASKHEQKSVVSALASTGKPIRVLSDLDTSKPESVFQGFASVITAKFNKSKSVFPTVQVTETGSTVDIFFAGLPSDPTLSAIGIESFAMDDYLIKLLDTDEAVKKWANVTPSELRKKAESLRDHASLKSSKILLSALGVTKNGLDPEELIKTIIGKADQTSVEKTVGPLSSLFTT